MGKIKKTVITGDWHLPYHDKYAVSTFFNFIKDFKPDELILNGDIGEGKSLSTHGDAGVDPMAPEYEMCNFLLDELRKTVGPKCKIVFASGNHQRLEKFLARQAPQLEGMLDIETILRLKERKIEHIPYKADVGYWINSKLFCHHGMFHNSNFTLTTLRKVGVSCIVSHAHRVQMMTESTIDKKGPQLRACWSIGCMVPVTNIPYFTAPSAWQQGWGIALTDLDTEEFSVYQCNLINHKLIAPNGKVYGPTKEGWTGIPKKRGRK